MTRISLVCFWFRRATLTVRSDHHGASGPDPAPPQAGTAGRSAGESAAATAGGDAVCVDYFPPGLHTVHRLPGSQSQVGCPEHSGSGVHRSGGASSPCPAQRGRPWRSISRSHWQRGSSSSPAGAGFFFMGKKDGTLRPYIDYRGINAMTVHNRYPLPLMDTAFELLQGATIFTKLGLKNAYHLVRIKEGDEWNTAFNTPTRHWEYLIMLFGLTNAPAVFQTLVNDVLGDMINRFVFVFS